MMRLGDERVPVLATYSSSAYQMLAFGNAKGRVVITKDWSIIRDFNAANGPIWSVVTADENRSWWPGLMISSHAGSFSSFRRNSSSCRARKAPSNHQDQQCENSSRGNAASAIRGPDANVGPTNSFRCFRPHGRNAEGYPYSQALLDSQIIWDEETINRLFAEGPDIVTPGTKMPIQRMKDPQDLTDLVTFLKMATKETIVE